MFGLGALGELALGDPGLRQLSMSASAGAYAQTGMAAALTATGKLAAAAGDYTLTGQGAVFRRTRIFPAARGTYVLGGKALGWRRALRLAPAAGAYRIDAPGVEFIILFPVLSETRRPLLTRPAGGVPASYWRGRT